MVGRSCGQFKQGDPRFGGLLCSGGRAAACDGRKRRITRVAAERVRPRHRVRPVVARRDGWRARERPMAHRPVRAVACPAEMRPLELTAIEAAQWRSFSLHAGWRAREASGGTHASTRTRRQAQTRARAHTQEHPRRTSQTHARTQHECKRACTQTHKLMHTNKPAHARMRRLRGTARRQHRVAGGNRTPSSCGSDARESGRLLLLLVCVAPASRVQRTRRCSQQTSAGSDVSRETAGDGSHDGSISACAAALQGRARRQCCLSVVCVHMCAGYSASDGRAPAPGAGGRRLLPLKGCGAEWDGMQMHRMRRRAHAIHFGLRPTASPPTTSATLACDEHPPRDRVRVRHPRLRARVHSCIRAFVHFCVRARTWTPVSECVSG